MGRSTRKRADNGGHSRALTSFHVERHHSSLPALQILLSKTIDFLLAAGLSRSTAARELEKQRKRVLQKKSNRRTKAEDRIQQARREVIEVCGVVHDWHRGEEYTNRNGEPVPLPAEALRGLIAKRFSPDRIQGAVVWMMDNRVIRRTKEGRFELIGGRPVLFGEKGRQAIALERAALVVPQYLQIILRNAATPDLDARDVDRDARVLFLPEKYVPLWRSLARERAQAFLEGMDNWLEDHARPDEEGPVREVGIHAYCYTGDSRVKKQTGSSSPKRRSGR
jgi:hypothetical protein